ncbi:hypothetical protein BJ508DRAFT_51510 [Ascobolus immersus RN42]|uniref:Uncharacterized protein n=1 Tax=Ascobolus immersus RN42 TaxID=1160509 RepID=A0A3N4ICK2_ASCIM|nr:hypothetical protein BJ508DRAFT_51510 [Ascobolus immersus RN42]
MKTSPIPLTPLPDSFPTPSFVLSAKKKQPPPLGTHPMIFSYSPSPTPSEISDRSTPVSLRRMQSTRNHPTNPPDLIGVESRALIGTFRQSASPTWAKEYSDIVRMATWRTKVNVR